MSRRLPVRSGFFLKIFFFWKDGLMTLHKLFHHAACVLTLVALVSGWKPAFAAQTVVVGTGNPDVDVPAVQAAVERNRRCWRSGRRQHVRHHCVKRGTIPDKLELCSGPFETGGYMAVVVGTNNPDVDVPAVQAAVNQPGDVILEGHFSFNRPPAIPTALAGYPLATVLVS